MSIRAVIFDLFDTLVDLPMENVSYREFRGRRIPSVIFDVHAALCERVDVEFERFALTMREVDHEFRRSHYEQGLELSTRDRFARLIERLQVDGSDLPDVLTATYMAHVSRHVEFVEHHCEVLASLHEHARIGLCSNFTHAATAVGILEQAALRQHFDALVISEQVGVRKPRPEIFQAALHALDVPPAEVVHVGDSLRADIGGAAALGIRTVWVTRRVPDPSRALGEYEGPAPDWQVADLVELPPLMRAVGVS